MIPIIRTLDRALAWTEEFFLAFSHGAIATLIVVAVFFRYVLNDPLTWTEEIVVLLFTWMLFVGLANGFRSRMHIRIDALLLVLSRRAWPVLGFCAATVTVLTLLGLTWFGLEQAIGLAGTETPMMRISAAWGVSAVPVGAALSLIHVLTHLLEHGVSETLWPADLGLNEETGS
jgi:TRAP-type C4-dicarboxylate transport system permease small subunit